MEEFHSGFTYTAYSNGALGDVDNDGKLEIIFQGDAADYSGYIFIINGSGYIEQEIVIPGIVSLRSLSIGDIDGDRDLEIFVVDVYGPTAKMHAYHHTGDLVSGWPVIPRNLRVKVPPVIGDIDGDQMPEVVFLSKDYIQQEKFYRILVSAFKADGTEVQGWPYELDRTANNLGAYSIGSLYDIDKDGDVELIFSYTYYLHPGIAGASYEGVEIFDIPQPYNEDTIEWSQNLHDIHNTLNYNYTYSPWIEVTSYSPEDLSPTVTEGNSIEFSITATHLSGEPLSYTWKLNGEIQSSSGSSWTHTFEIGSAGDNIVTCEVSDGTLSTPISWYITVNVKFPPVFSPDIEGKTYTITPPVASKLVRLFPLRPFLTVEATDLDADNVTISTSVLPGFVRKEVIGNGTPEVTIKFYYNTEFKMGTSPIPLNPEITITASNGTRETSATFKVELQLSPNKSIIPLCSDQDKDGYGSPATQWCEHPEEDCNDFDPTIHPGAEEICDGKDNNCDGVIPLDEIDGDADGMLVCQGDCNDTDPTVHPGAAEVCDNGKDDDCDGYIASQDSDCQTLWPFETSGAIYSSPAVADINGDSSLEVLFGSNDNHLYCINNQGGLLWQYLTGGYVESSPAIADLVSERAGLEVVVGGSSDKKVSCIDSVGNLVWQYTAGSYINHSSPAVADLDGDGSLEVLVGLGNGKLHCLRAQDGQLKWEYLTGNDIYSSPAVADLDGDGSLEVLVGSNDKKLHCVKKDGQIFVPSEPQGPIDPLPWPMFHHDIRHTGYYYQRH